MFDKEDHLKACVAQLAKAYEQKGVYNLFPFDILNVGSMFMGPLAGLIIRGIKADQYRKDATLKPEEKLLLRLAAKEKPELTWLELWFMATGRKNEIPKLYINNTFHRKAREEVLSPLQRIGGIYCFIGEYGEDFFPRIWPEENKWWIDFFTKWGIAKNPLGYARRYAPDQPNPTLEEVIDNNLAKDFRELCEAVCEILKDLNLKGWKPRSLTPGCYGHLANSIQTQYTVVGEIGMMWALMGKSIIANTHGFSVLENSKDKSSWNQPIRLTDILLIGPYPRVNIRVDEDVPAKYFHQLGDCLRAQRNQGKFPGLHIKIVYTSWKVQIDPIPIGENDLDPKIWKKQQLVGPTRFVEEE